MIKYQGKLITLTTLALKLSTGSTSPKMKAAMLRYWLFQHHNS